LRCGWETFAAAGPRPVAIGGLSFVASGAVVGRSIASIFFAAAMRTASEPVRGILRSFFVGFTPVFAGDFFAAVFLVVVLFLALELLRVFLPGLIFFIMRVILHFGSGNVKAES
jgi:hypothetical protein